ncbi:hypothetical protein BKA67DRAFT_534651 [Truncatella angustata]|uniref:Uncharacterized protein n=1 Tax=Truncatella angustata TaxID=152316 RepID=A0A9P9A072_9PEZI|nr:uncharacterized protein BKA67DRAFT_534651 [Truncatella angustata]KAH6655734.1 hypothetical protein BKA67DRAFT_534651 [Truncatella angustata]
MSCLGPLGRSQSQGAKTKMRMPRECPLLPQVPDRSSLRMPTVLCVDIEQSGGTDRCHGRALILLPPMQSIASGMQTLNQNKANGGTCARAFNLAPAYNALCVCTGAVEYVPVSILTANYSSSKNCYACVVSLAPSQSNAKQSIVTGDLYANRNGIKNTAIIRNNPGKRGGKSPATIPRILIHGLVRVYGRMTFVVVIAIDAFSPLSFTSRHFALYEHCLPMHHFPSGAAGRRPPKFTVRVIANYIPRTTGIAAEPKPGDDTAICSPADYVFIPT